MEKNTTFLYDLVITHALECPSLTVEWLSDQEEPPGKDYSVQKVILGTHTSKNKPNYLMLAQVQQPLQAVENDARHYNDERAEFGGFGCANGKIHEGVVEDVAWHLRHEYLFGSVGDDRYIHIWDLHSPSVSKPIQSVVAHQSEVGALILIHRIKKFKVA